MNKLSSIKSWNGVVGLVIPHGGLRFLVTPHGSVLGMGLLRYIRGVRELTQEERNKAAYLIRYTRSTGRKAFAVSNKIKTAYPFLERISLCPTLSKVKEIV